jgi:hypothetical protein
LHAPLRSFAKRRLCFAIILPRFAQEPYVFALASQKMLAIRAATFACMNVKLINNAGEQDRNFKQESRRNKKFRFRKSNKRPRAEKIAPSCPL